MAAPMMMKTKHTNGADAGFSWTRSIALPMSDPLCVHCEGAGLVRTRNGVGPCRCVCRNICKAVVAECHKIVSSQGARCSQTAEKGGRRGRRYTYQRPLEDFVADAFLIARRTLKNRNEWRVFQYAMLDDEPFEPMMRRTGLDRGNYFHLYYRVQVRLGKAWAETRPFGLWPLDEYFGGNRAVDVEIARERT